MKKLLLLVMCAGTLAAGPVLTLDPLDGNVSGPAGGVVGWGFTLTSDSSQWVSVIGTVLLFESNSSLGIYLDFIGTEGGPVSGILAPGSPAWTEAFDPAFGQGLGEFLIDPAASPGNPDSGTFRVLYETFSADPNTCGGCLIDSQFVEAPFTVSVADPAPEPGSAMLMALAGALAVAWKSRWPRPRGSR
jgi:hypothetical protein